MSAESTSSTDILLSKCSTTGLFRFCCHFVLFCRLCYISYMFILYIHTRIHIHSHPSVWICFTYGLYKFYLCFAENAFTCIVLFICFFLFFNILYFLCCIFPSMLKLWFRHKTVTYYNVVLCKFKLKTHNKNTTKKYCYIIKYVMLVLIILNFFCISAVLRTISCFCT